MKKTAYIMVGIIFSAVLIACFILFFRQPSISSNAYLRVSLNSQVIRELPLDTNYSETIFSDDGYNVISIQDGSVIVSSADCDNQICVHSAAINMPGETIACLPHRLLLEIVEGDPS